MINSAIKINIKYYETIKSRTISHKLGKDILTLKIGRVLESVLTNNKRTSKKSKDKTIEKRARDESVISRNRKQEWLLNLWKDVKLHR